MERESDGDTSDGCCTWNNTQRMGKEIGRIRIKRTSRDYPDYSIIKIGRNTEKSPGDLRRLAVSQPPVKNHQLMMLWKTPK